MQVKALLSLLALSQAPQVALATSSQESETRDVGLPEPNELQERQQVIIDCNKLLEQTIGILKEYPSYSAKVRAIGENGGLGGVFAYSVCRAFKTDVLDCRFAGSAVASGISLAIVNGFFDGGADGTEPVAPEKRQDALVSALESQIYSKGLSVESISMSPHQRRDTDGPLGFDVDILGLYDAINDVHSDIHMNNRGNGSGHMKVLPAAARGNAATKRDDASSGAKVSWEAYNVAGQPVQNAYESFAQLAADDWAAKATDDPDMVDYIGLIDFSRFGQIQYIISPQAVGEDSEHEDVNTCEA